MVRGDDLLSSAPRQAYLATRLGYRPPGYSHVPMVLNDKESGSANATVRSPSKILPPEGVTTTTVLSRLAESLGLADHDEIVDTATLAARFDSASLPAILDHHPGRLGLSHPRSVGGGQEALQDVVDGEHPDADVTVGDGGDVTSGVAHLLQRLVYGRCGVEGQHGPHDVGGTHLVVGGYGVTHMHNTVDGPLARTRESGGNRSDGSCPGSRRRSRRGGRW